MTYLKYKYRHVLIFIILILITTSSTSQTFQKRQVPDPGDPGPSAPPPPPGPCKDCIDKCCETALTCIKGPNPGLCENGLKQCNVDCNMEGCKDLTYHFDCKTQQSPGPGPSIPNPVPSRPVPNPGDPGPSAPPPLPISCKDCIDKCCETALTCIKGPNPGLCENGLKQCNV